MQSARSFFLLFRALFAMENLAGDAHVGRLQRVLQAEDHGAAEIRL